MNTKVLLVMIAVFFSVGTSLMAKTKVTRQDRQRMAEMHSRMATCLQSDKPLNECQGEMMKSCKGMMERTGCPMMEMGHMNEMMGQDMMNQEEKSQPEKNKKK